MDHGHFDDLTRSVADGAGTRRAVLRLLAGGALGGVAAQLGLIEGTEAKAKKHKAKPKREPQAERKGQGQLQAEGKRKGKKGKKKPKNPPPPPPPPCGAGMKQCPDTSCVPSAQCCPGKSQCPDGSCVTQDQCCAGKQKCSDGSCVPAANMCCPAAARCQVVRQDTADGTVDLEACSGDGGAHALCDTAMGRGTFRALTNYLLSTGFSLADDPQPQINFYEVHEDDTHSEDVLILRFAKQGTGETALLRYGEGANGQQASTYALLQQDGTPTALLSVNGNGTVVSTPVEGSASRGTRRRTGRAAGVAASSSADNPYDGQADEMCLECRIVCRSWAPSNAG